MVVPPRRRIYLPLQSPLRVAPYTTLEPVCPRTLAKYRTPRASGPFRLGRQFIRRTCASKNRYTRRRGALQNSTHTQSTDQYIWRQPTWAVFPRNSPRGRRRRRRRRCVLGSRHRWRRCSGGLIGTFLALRVEQVEWGGRVGPILGDLFDPARIGRDPRVESRHAFGRAADPVRHYANHYRLAARILRVDMALVRWLAPSSRSRS